MTVTSGHPLLGADVVAASPDGVAVVLDDDSAPELGEPSPDGLDGLDGPDGEPPEPDAGAPWVAPV